jgi:hypothetical protein
MRMHVGQRYIVGGNRRQQGALNHTLAHLILSIFFIARGSSGLERLDRFFAGVGDAGDRSGNPYPSGARLVVLGSDGADRFGSAGSTAGPLTDAGDSGRLSAEGSVPGSAGGTCRPVGSGLVHGFCGSDLVRCRYRQPGVARLERFRPGGAGNGADDLLAVLSRRRTGAQQLHPGTPAAALLCLDLDLRCQLESDRAACPDHHLAAALARRAAAPRRIPRCRRGLAGTGRLLLVLGIGALGRGVDLLRGVVLGGRAHPAVPACAADGRRLAVDRGAARPSIAGFGARGVGAVPGRGAAAAGRAGHLSAGAGRLAAAHGAVRQADALGPPLHGAADPARRPVAVAPARRAGGAGQVGPAWLPSPCLRSGGCSVT